MPTPVPAPVPTPKGPSPSFMLTEDESDGGDPSYVPAPAPLDMNALQLSTDEDVVLPHADVGETTPPGGSLARGLVVAASGCSLVGINSATRVRTNQRASFKIFAGDAKGFPMVKGGDDFTVYFEGPGSADVTIDDMDDGTYEVAYTLSQGGKHTAHVRLGSKYGPPVEGSPVEFMVDGDDGSEASAPGPHSARVSDDISIPDEAYAILEGRDLPEHQPGSGGDQDGQQGSSGKGGKLVSGDAQGPRSSFDSEFASVMEAQPEMGGLDLEAYEKTVLVNSVLHTQQTLSTLKMQAADLSAVTTGVLAQVAELEEKQAALVTEWKRSEMKRSKIATDMQELVAKCSAAGVPVNTAFLEQPESFDAIVSRIHRMLGSPPDSGASPLDDFGDGERSALRDCLVREVAELSAQTSAAHALLDDVLTAKLRFVAKPALGVGQAEYVPAGEASGPSAPRHNNDNDSAGDDEYDDDSPFFRSGPRSGSGTPSRSRRNGAKRRDSAASGLGGGSDAVEHSYDVARSEIRNMKAAAKKSAMRHRLMLARVKQLEDARFEPEEKGLTHKGAKLGSGSGTRRRGSGPIGGGGKGAGAGNANRDDFRYGEQLNKLSLAHESLKGKYHKLEEENNILKKKLRDALKAADSKLKRASQEHFVALTDMKRKFDNELELKHAEVVKLQGEKRLQVVEMRSALEHAHKKELRAIRREHALKAAALREELADLKRLIEADANVLLPRSRSSPDRKR